MFSFSLIFWMSEIQYKESNYKSKYSQTQDLNYIQCSNNCIYVEYTGLVLLTYCSILRLIILCYVCIVIICNDLWRHWDISVYIYIVISHCCSEIKDIQVSEIPKVVVLDGVTGDESGMLRWLNLSTATNL